MRDSIKNIGLILALVIAGVSLPIGIIGFNRPADVITISNNYYYNTTIIEQYNTTIEIEDEILTLPLTAFIITELEDDYIFLVLNFTLNCKNWLYFSHNETNRRYRINIYLLNWKNEGIINPVWYKILTTSDNWSPEFNGDYMIEFYNEIGERTNDFTLYLEILVGD